MFPVEDESGKFVPRAGSTQRHSPVVAGGTPPKRIYREESSVLPHKSLIRTGDDRQTYEFNIVIALRGENQ